VASDATRFQLKEGVLEALPPHERRLAIRALADVAGNQRRNPLWRFDPLDPQGCGIPHVPQDAWLRNHHTPEGRGVKFRIAPGGNRGGKTTTGDLSVIIDCTPSEFLPPHLLAYKRWEPPIQVYLIAVSGRAVEKIHVPIFKQWCPRDILVGNDFTKAFNKEYQTLHFKDGTTVSFMTQGMDVEVFQGTALHIVHFDEEPLWDHGEEIFAECMQRLVDYNGDLRMTFTPLDGMTWVYDKLWLPWSEQQPEREQAVSGFATISFNGVDLPVYGHRFHQDDNPVIDPEGKAAALAMAKDDQDRKARQTGLFVAMSGRTFDEFSRSRHVVPDEDVLERLRASTLQLLIGGLDPGYRHMAAALWVGLDHDGVWVGPEVVCEKTIIPHVAQTIQAAAHHWKLPLPLFVADPAIVKTDSQTGKTDQTAYLETGIATRIGINTVRPGINAIQALCYKNRLHVMASNEVLIDQLLRGRWKKTARSEDAAPERPVKRDDHATDALRYAIMALPIPEALPPEDKRTKHQKMVSDDIAQAVEEYQQGPAEFGSGYWE
jgi:phage terminase large subunit-like protein